jgi:hypothetical protein
MSVSGKFSSTFSPDSVGRVLICGTWIRNPPRSTMAARRGGSSRLTVEEEPVPPAAGTSAVG